MLGKASKAPWTALVLSGGGARGAYEAGVIRYLRDELPPRVRAHLRFEVICGTSVGAINCCFLASNNHIPEVQGQALTEVWKRLRIDGVYHVGMRELLNLPKFLFGSRGRGELDDAVGPERLGGLFNTSPLEQLVGNSLRWKNIGANLASGDLKALALTATHVATGNTHVFVQRSEPGLPPFTSDSQVHAFLTEIGPAHALASSAIPWIFPAVEINGEIYCDGAIKLNTPISPAIRLGADRLFVIGLKSHAEEENERTLKNTRIDRYPSAIFLLGRILDALLVDKTDYDLKRLQHINAILKMGQELAGAQFEGALEKTLLPLRGSNYRPIESLVIRPSEDVAQIANRHLQTGTIAARAGSLVGPFLRQMGEASQGQAGDLLSYLLFDSEFANDLIALGMRDADAKRQQIIDFFSA